MRRGFTLIELVVAIFLLFLILSTTILAFYLGTRSFHHAILRQGLQGDTQKLAVLLGRDVRLTDYHSAFIVPRTYITADGDSVQRDGLAIAALSDWQDPNRFDPVTGLPLWDRYVVYYATDDADSGALIRQVIDPGAPTNGVPYFALGSNLLTDPTLNSGHFAHTVISDQVHHFELSLSDSSASLEVRLVLRRAGARRAGSGEVVDEALESEFSLTARNTFPKL